MAYRVRVQLSSTAASRLRNLNPRQAAQAVIDAREGGPDWRVDVVSQVVRQVDGAHRGGDGR